MRRRMRSGRNGEPHQGAAALLFADRTSCRTLRGQSTPPLALDGPTYCDAGRARRAGLKTRRWRHAHCDTIRLKLLKIGAVVRVTVRRVWLPCRRPIPGNRLARYTTSSAHGGISRRPSRA